MQPPDGNPDGNADQRAQTHATEQSQSVTTVERRGIKTMLTAARPLILAASLYRSRQNLIALSGISGYSPLLLLQISLPEIILSPRLRSNC